MVERATVTVPNLVGQAAPLPSLESHAEDDEDV